MKKNTRFSIMDRVSLRLIAVRSWLSHSFGSECLNEVESSLTGVWPNGARTPDVILVACDDVYFRKFGRGFLNSVIASSHEHAIHIHLLEPSRETLQEVERIRQTQQRLHLSYTSDPCLPTRGLQLRNLYYNASRFVLAPLLLKRGVQRLLILDIDSLMNSSPWARLDSLGSKIDLAMIRRTNKRQPQAKILASAVYYRSGRHGLKFSESFARSILKALRNRPKLRYHVDQILPYYVMWFAGIDRKAWYSDIPAGIMDYDFNNDASFWTAKGERKHDDAFLARFGNQMLAK